MTVNCYICGAKVPMPVLPLFLNLDGKVMCDDCKKKYGKSNVGIFEDMKNQSAKADNEKKLHSCSVCGKGLDIMECWMTDGNIYCAECHSQQAKADSGKPNLSLVPKQIIYEIEKVRNFGVQKYKEPDNWKKVELERYHQALLRHTLAIWNDVQAKDKESGLLHLSHIACNIAFILELMNDKENEK